MYQFYYDYMKPKCGDKCKLLSTDTDSFCCHTQRDDLYNDMSKKLDLFNTSNFEKDYPLYTTKDHCILGKFKSNIRSLALSVSGRKCRLQFGFPNNKKHSKIRAKVFFKNPASKIASNINSLPMSRILLNQHLNLSLHKSRPVDPRN